jgi:hypothetical protein
MVLSDDDIRKFQDLYRERFGKEISKEDAYEQGIKLLRLMSVVYRPMTEAEYNNIQERRSTTSNP